MSDALAYIEEAIDALSIHMERSPAEGDLSFAPVAPIEATIAIELERVDSALGLRGQSMFFPLAERIKQAMVAMHAARAALSAPPSHPASDQ